MTTMTTQSITPAKIVSATTTPATTTPATTTPATTTPATTATTKQVNYNNHTARTESNNLLNFECHLDSS